MRSHDDRYRRVTGIYDGRAVAAGAQAATYAADASEHRAQAAGTREAAQLQRELSRVAEETGLTRAAFFDRLRSVAVARAHVAETLLHAQTQDEAAMQSEVDEAEARQRAALAARKRDKLTRWLDRNRQNERAATLRRADTQTQEDYAWR